MRFFFFVRVCFRFFFFGEVVSFFLGEFLFYWLV